MNGSKKGRRFDWRGSISRGLEPCCAAHQLLELARRQPPPKGVEFEPRQLMREKTYETTDHRKIRRPVESDVACKVHFVLNRDVEQGAEVFHRRRRRIPDFGDKGSDIEEQPRLPLAHWCERGRPARPGGVDCKGELMVLVLELSPSLVQYRG